MKRVLYNTNNEIAIAKAIGIMMVVLWHADPPYIIGKFMMLFCVPLFFFTAGYFFKPPTNINELRIYFIKRIKGLYVPFVLYSLMFLLFHNLYFHIGIYNIKNDIPYYHITDFISNTITIMTKMAYQERLLGPLWFLNALFFTSLFISTTTYILKKIKYYNKYLLLVALILIAILSKYYIEHWHYFNMIAMISLSSCFFISGNIYKDYENDIKRHATIVFWICLFLTILGTVINTRIVEMTAYLYSDIISYFIYANAGIIMTLNIAKHINNNNLDRIFIYMGNHTLVILALHTLCFKLVSFIKIYVYNLSMDCLADYPVILQHNEWFFIIYFIIGLILPLGIYSAYYKLLIPPK